MSKDPAFLFYSQDFLIGVAELSNEEVGQFIKILAYMHQKGRMKEETISLLVGSVSDNLRLKFGIDKDNLWFNERLETEAEKRSKFTESRRVNGKLGGRPKAKLAIKASGKPKQNLMEDENENKDEIKIVDEIIYPYGNEKFLTHWELWKQYKLKEHSFSFKSNISEQASLKKLGEISKSEDEAIKILNEAMANGYKGFFELKNPKDGKHRKVDLGSLLDDLR